MSTAVSEGTLLFSHSYRSGWHCNVTLRFVTQKLHLYVGTPLVRSLKKVDLCTSLR
jgi:hypothetical protein